MKALSIQQPWAWLIVNGYKGVENRDWDTRFRGEFLIHAGKKFDLEGMKWISQTFPSLPLPLLYEAPRGGIVGKATLINTVHIRDRHLLAEKDKPWFFGDYGFILDGAATLPFEPYKGQLGFFDVTLSKANQTGGE